MEVSFVIPCFRPTMLLRELVEQLCLLARDEVGDFEIILVDDSAGADTTLLEHIESDYSEVHLMKLSRNFGQQAATVAGIVRTTGNVIVTLDDDFQHSPADAIQMVRILKARPDVQLVYAKPQNQSQSHNRVRSGQVFRLLLEAAGLEFARSISPFRAFRGYLRVAFESVAGPNISIDVVLSWVVDKVETVECVFKPRELGVSGYSTRSLIGLALSVFLSYSTRPLRAGIYLGAFGVAVAIGYGGLIGFQYIVGGITVAGFATTTLLILFLGSLNLLILGILGLYIGEQHERGMQRPAFLVQPLGDRRGSCEG